MIKRFGLFQMHISHFYTYSYFLSFFCVYSFMHVVLCIHLCQYTFLPILVAHKHTMSTRKQQPLVHHEEQTFSQLWQQAQRQGWYLGPEHNDSNAQMVFPPKNHPAALDHWAAVYNNVNYENKLVAVPHWFYSQVGGIQKHSSTDRSPIKRRNCTIN